MQLTMIKKLATIIIIGTLFFASAQFFSYAIQTQPLRLTELLLSLSLTLLIAYIAYAQSKDTHGFPRFLLFGAIATWGIFIFIVGISGFFVDPFSIANDSWTTALIKKLLLFNGIAVFVAVRVYRSTKSRSKENDAS